MMIPKKTSLGVTCFISNTCKIDRLDKKEKISKSFVCIWIDVVRPFTNKKESLWLYISFIYFIFIPIYIYI